MKVYYKIEARYKNSVLLTRYRIGFVGELLFFFALGIIFLDILGIFDFHILKHFIKLIDLKDTQLARQIIFSQVSISFLILSLLSFLTNLKKDKILGTSVYKIVFAYSIFGNLALLSVIVFGLLFTNIFFYFQNPKSIVIPYLFLSSMILLSMYITKIIIYTNNQKKSANKIFALYYCKNIKIVKHNFIAHHQNYEPPQIIFDLIEDTEEKIRSKNIDYNTNFQVYNKLSNLTLRNYRKQTQENHTEKFRKKDDILIYWIRQIDVLIECNLLSAAIEQYNYILWVLISNEVYLDNYDLSQMLSKILDGLKHTTNIYLFKELEDKIFKSISLTVRYSYYRLNNDFSYTRLGQYQEVKILYIHSINGDFYKKYYQIIWSSEAFSETEKKRMTYFLIEKIRMLAIDVDDPFHNDYFSLNTSYYEVLNNEKNNLDGDLELIGIPLSLLFYEAILKKDYTSISHLIYAYNMNSIYFACLMVTTKLVTQYLRDFGDTDYLKETIKLLSMKLENFDSYKLKLNKMKIQKSEMGEDRVYSIIFLNNADKKALSLLYQSIQMKKHKVDIEKIRNPDLIRVYEIVFDDSDRKDINKKWRAYCKNISDLIISPI